MRLVALVALVCAFSARTSHACEDCPAPGFGTTTRLRLVGDFANRDDGPAHAAATDRAATLEIEWGKAYVDWQSLVFSYRPTRWRSGATRAYPGELSAAWRFRHLLVTDHTAYDVPITPWLDGSLGTSRKLRDHSRVTIGGHSEWLAGVGGGVDAWVNPRWALYTAGRYEWTKSRPFLPGRTSHVPSVELGLVYTMAARGRSR